MAEVPQELKDKCFEAVELARESGKIKKGANEVTKAIERGNAKLVVYAENTTPPEIVMHLKPLCDEKDVLCLVAPTKEELGTIAGIPLSTAAIAVTEEGNAKKVIQEIKKNIENPVTEAPKEETKEEAKEEEPAAEEKQEETKKEGEAEATQE